MIELKKGSLSDRIVVTLTERSRLNTSYYLFVFTGVTESNVIKWIAGTDESKHPKRYNQFTINTSEVFNSSPEGEYHYKVYEQKDNVNTDEANTFRMVEEGKMRLEPSEEFEFKQYNGSTEYKAYNG